MQRILCILLCAACFHFSTCFSMSSQERVDMAKQGFLVRWDCFQEGRKPFPLWSPEWKEEELKARFDEMYVDRWHVYFTNLEDMGKKGPVGKYKEAYKLAEGSEKWHSRYPPGPTAFSYNQASLQYNASIITLHGNCFIAMEAPSKETLEPFLQVIQEYPLSHLVRLTPAFLGEEETCFPYWEGHLSDDTLKIAGKSIRYFFIDNWKDKTEIEPSKLLSLVKEVMNSNPKMVGVHCRAGIGRTGVFIAAYALISEIDRQLALGVDPAHLRVSIDRIVWELSLQRPFAVTYFPLYRTLYQLVSMYIT